LRETGGISRALSQVELFFGGPNQNIAGSDQELPIKVANHMNPPRHQTSCNGLMVMVPATAAFLDPAFRSDLNQRIINCLPAKTTETDMHFTPFLHLTLQFFHIWSFSQGEKIIITKLCCQYDLTTNKATVNRSNIFVTKSICNMK